MPAPKSPGENGQNKFEIDNLFIIIFTLLEIDD